MDNLDNSRLRLDDVIDPLGSLIDYGDSEYVPQRGVAHRMPRWSRFDYVAIDWLLDRPVPAGFGFFSELSRIEIFSWGIDRIRLRNRHLRLFEWLFLQFYSRSGDPLDPLRSACHSHLYMQLYAAANLYRPGAACRAAYENILFLWRYLGHEPVRDDEHGGIILRLQRVEGDAFMEAPDESQSINSVTGDLAKLVLDVMGATRWMVWMGFAKEANLTAALMGGMTVAMMKKLEGRNGFDERLGSSLNSLLGSLEATGPGPEPQNSPPTAEHFNEGIKQLSEKADRLETRAAEMDDHWLPQNHGGVPWVQGVDFEPDIKLETPPPTPPPPGEPAPTQQDVGPPKVNSWDRQLVKWRWDEKNQKLITPPYDWIIYDLKMDERPPPSWIPAEITDADRQLSPNDLREIIERRMQELWRTNRWAHQPARLQPKRRRYFSSVRAPRKRTAEEVEEHRYQKQIKLKEGAGDLTMIELETEQDWEKKARQAEKAAAAAMETAAMDAKEKADKEYQQVLQEREADEALRKIAKAEDKARAAAVEEDTKRMVWNMMRATQREARKRAAAKKNPPGPPPPKTSQSTTLGPSTTRPKEEEEGGRPSTAQNEPENFVDPTLSSDEEGVSEEQDDRSTASNGFEPTTPKKRKTSQLDPVSTAPKTTTPKTTMTKTSAAGPSTTPRRKKPAPKDGPSSV